MAALEAALGVRATYYVMVRSPYYNAFSLEVRTAVQMIAHYGHEIGTHVDLGVRRDSTIDVLQVGWKCLDQRLLLQEALGDDVEVSRFEISLHCPPRSWVWREIPGFDSLYDPRWEGRYRSDSAPPGGRGRFRFGDPEDVEARPLQVVLHPEHWFAPTPEPDRRYFWR